MILLRVNSDDMVGRPASLQEITKRACNRSVGELRVEAEAGRLIQNWEHTMTTRVQLCRSYEDVLQCTKSSDEQQLPLELSIYSKTGGVHLSARSLSHVLMLTQN